MTMAGNITSDAIAGLELLSRAELGERFKQLFNRLAPKGMSRLRTRGFAIRLEAKESRKAYRLAQVEA